MELEGRVVRKPFAPSTKSDSEAFYLESAQGSYVLRRIGANPFEDDELESLVGSRVRCSGDLDLRTKSFFVTDCHVIDRN